MKRLQADLLLLLAALIWGTSFVAQHTGMRDVGPLLFTGSRFLLGALVVAPFAWWEWQRLARAGRLPDRRALYGGVALGGLLFLGAIFQQIGIAGTTVSNAGFLTALYVPLVPLIAAMFLGDRVHWIVWPASVGCLAGTYLLGGGSLTALVAGDFWVMLSALFWAAHVLVVGRVAVRMGTPMGAAFLQFLVCGLLGMVLGSVVETVDAAALLRALPSIAYAGILSVGIGFTLQVVAQRHTPAADAAILLSCETLFAAIAARMFLGETLSAVQIVGGTLIFASVLSIQILPILRFGRAKIMRPRPAA
ncbi:MAG TPA: DMT family transporter [Rhodocyclaceae bacterium]